VRSISHEDHKINRSDTRARFEAEVLPHLDAAYRFARWLCRGAADAEDVVHDAVLRAFRAFDDSHILDPKAWLLSIVRNCHLSAIKRRRPEVALAELSDESLGELSPLPPTPEEESQRAEGQKTFQVLLQALPFAQREILVLRELEEMSYGEIAQITGVPMGTVMSRLARARTALRELWERREPGVSHGMS
jgi:RNA polymerase sigma factor (sigma-70 family)